MADRAPQNFSNHTRFDPPFHFFILPVFAITLIMTIVHLVRRPGLHSAWLVIVMIAALAAIFKIRLNALKVQDRIIRLEMRLRLAEILPADLRPRIQEFTPAQMVSMRFAGDAELPAIARKVLADKLNDRKAIKQLVKDWQGDYLRA